MSSSSSPSSSSSDKAYEPSDYELEVICDTREIPDGWLLTGRQMMALMARLKVCAVKLTDAQGRGHNGFTYEQGRNALPCDESFEPFESCKGGLFACFAHQYAQWTRPSRSHFAYVSYEPADRIYFESGGKFKSNALTYLPPRLSVLDHFASGENSHRGFENILATQSPPAVTVTVSLVSWCAANQPIPEFSLHEWLQSLAEDMEHVLASRVLRDKVRALPREQHGLAIDADARYLRCWTDGEPTQPLAFALVEQAVKVRPELLFHVCHAWGVHDYAQLIATTYAASEANATALLKETHQKWPALLVQTMQQCMAASEKALVEVLRRGTLRYSSFVRQRMECSTGAVLLALVTRETSAFAAQIPYNVVLEFLQEHPVFFMEMAEELQKHLPRLGCDLAKLRPEILGYEYSGDADVYIMSEYDWREVLKAFGSDVAKLKQWYLSDAYGLDKWLKDQSPHGQFFAMCPVAVRKQLWEAFWPDCGLFEALFRWDKALPPPETYDRRFLQSVLRTNPAVIGSLPPLPEGLLLCATMEARGRGAEFFGNFLAVRVQALPGGPRVLQLVLRDSNAREYLLREDPYVLVSRAAPDLDAAETAAATHRDAARFVWALNRYYEDAVCSGAGANLEAVARPLAEAVAIEPAAIVHWKHPLRARQQLRVLKSSAEALCTARALQKSQALHKRAALFVCMVHGACVLPEALGAWEAHVRSSKLEACALRSRDKRGRPEEAARDPAEEDTKRRAREGGFC